jgi:hypothetical protein
MDTRSKYIVTDSLCVQTGSAETPMEGIKLIYKQLRASTYIKDARTLSVLGEDGIYQPLGSYNLVSGCISWALGIVKHWRNTEKAAGRDCFLNLYYKELDICPKCKGNKGKLEYVSPAAGYMVTQACDFCKGQGAYCEPPTPPNFTLVVREQIYNGSGEGKRTVDMALENGTLTVCFKCYRDIRGAYKDCQFRIENESGQIVGIEVHGEILWLANVPPPKYFVKPAPKTPAPERPEICMAGTEGGWVND